MKKLNDQIEKKETFVNSLASQNGKLLTANNEVQNRINALEAKIKKLNEDKKMYEKEYREKSAENKSLEEVIQKLIAKKNRNRAIEKET